MTKVQKKLSGVIQSIAWRGTDGQPMAEIEKCTVIPKRGMDCENRKHGKREVTLLSVQSWKDVCNELGQDIPWTTRRANFFIDGLIDGMKLSDTIGKTIAIGQSVRVHIYKETRPCQLMEDQFTGLKAALQPDFRGGVHGQVTVGGDIQIGDEVTIVS